MPGYCENQRKECEIQTLQVYGFILTDIRRYYNSEGQPVFFDRPFLMKIYYGQSGTKI
jgi:hypothetical protein